MSDPYIDQYETQSYGPFATQQIDSLAIGVDKAFDPLLRHLAGLLNERTTALGELLKAAERHVVVTYTSVEGDGDPVAEAKDTLRKLVSYVDSRDGAEDIRAAVLQGNNLSVFAKMRPARIPAALAAAALAVEHHKSSLPEHAVWGKRLRSAHERVSALNTKVRETRSTRREMTPDIAAAREAWLTAYAALKLATESLLRLHGKTRLMPEIFDDLAEVHRLADVSDADPTPTPTPAP